MRFGPLLKSTGPLLLILAAVLVSAPASAVTPSVTSWQQAIRALPLSGVGCFTASFPPQRNGTGSRVKALPMFLLALKGPARRPQLWGTVSTLLSGVFGGAVRQRDGVVPSITRDRPRSPRAIRSCRTPLACNSTQVSFLEPLLALAHRSRANVLVGAVRPLDESEIGPQTLHAVLGLSTTAQPVRLDGSPIRGAATRTAPPPRRQH